MTTNLQTAVYSYLAVVGFAVVIKSLTSSQLCHSGSQPINCI